tara:strand:- start:1692 stop:3395 length:1704 start_codon:yes stop_codon:yes gene_type:complete
MPWDLFGFTVSRKKAQKSVEPAGGGKQLPSFVAPDAEDGSTPIQMGAYYGHYVDLDGNLKNDIDQIKQYRSMSLHAEIESAIDDIINEAIVTEEGTPTVKVLLDDLEQPETIKKKIREEFDHILRLLDFNNRGYEIFRRWYVDGKLFQHIIVDPKNKKSGIQEVRQIDSTKIRKIQQIKKEKDPGSEVEIIKKVEEFYMYSDKGPGGPMQDTQGLKIHPDAISYIHSGLYDSARKLVISYLHKAIKPLNQLRMIEDAVVIYRIARAPERRIFYVDVGSLPKTKAEEYVKDIMNRYRNKLVYDANTGELKDERKYMSMLEDFWMPRREGGKGTEISTLDGGQNLGEMEDVDYFKKKLYRALNVPISRLESDNGFNMGRASEITRDELKFSKFVSKLRSKFNGIFFQLLEKQLVLKGVIREDEWDDIKHDIRLDYLRDSHFTELKNAELLENRLQILGDIDQYVGRYFSADWVRSNVLMQDEEEIEKIDKQIQEEKMSGKAGGERDAEQIRYRIEALETLDQYIGKYYSLGWVRQNILMQSEEEIDVMDKQIKKELDMGIGPDTPSKGT